MTETVLNWVSLHGGGDFVHKALIGPSVLNVVWRSQIGSPQRRLHQAGHRALARNLSGSQAYATDAAGRIRRDGVAEIPKETTRWVGRGSCRNHLSRGETRECARYEVARPCGSSKCKTSQRTLAVHCCNALGIPR